MTKCTCHEFNKKSKNYSPLSSPKLPLAPPEPILSPFGIKHQEGALNPVILGKDKLRPKSLEKQK